MIPRWERRGRRSRPGRRAAPWARIRRGREEVRGVMAEVPAASASCVWWDGGESQATLVETKDEVSKRELGGAVRCPTDTGRWARC